MPSIFGRKYSLVIGRPKQILKSVQTIPRFLASPEVLANNKTIAPDQKFVQDYRTIPQSFFEITDLQITAKVVYTKKTKGSGGSQTTELTIHNLAQATKDAIKKDDVVLLRAGYEQTLSSTNDRELPLIFVGQITKVSSERSGSDVITSIVCGDSITAKKNYRITQSWPPQTSRRVVLGDMLTMANDMGVPTGKAVGFQDSLSILDGVYPAGYSVSGFLFDAIADLCEGIDFRFYLALGKMYVEPKIETITAEVVTLTSDGIIGNIEPMEDATNELSGAVGDVGGVKVEAFLEGKITTNKILRLDASTGKHVGDYTIDSVSHRLDFEGNDWRTIMECTKIKKGST